MSEHVPGVRPLWSPGRGRESVGHVPSGSRPGAREWSFSDLDPDLAQSVADELRPPLRSSPRPTPTGSPVMSCPSTAGSFLPARSCRATSAEHPRRVGRLLIGCSAA